jgi:hypothetical protein
MTAHGPGVHDYPFIGEMPQPPPPPEPPRKRWYRRWPAWIGIAVIAVFIAALIASLAGGGGSKPTAQPTNPPSISLPPAQVSPPTEEPPTTEPSSRLVQLPATTLKVGETAHITDFNQAQDTNVQGSTWSESVPQGAAPRYPVVVAQAGDGATTISCKITDDGEVKAEQTSHGQYAVVTLLCPIASTCGTNRVPRYWTADSAERRRGQVLSPLRHRDARRGHRNQEAPQPHKIGLE